MRAGPRKQCARPRHDAANLFPDEAFQGGAGARPFRILSRCASRAVRSTLQNEVLLPGHAAGGAAGGIARTSRGRPHRATPFGAAARPVPAAMRRATCKACYATLQTRGSRAFRCHARPPGAHCSSLLALFLQKPAMRRRRPHARPRPPGLAGRLRRRAVPQRADAGGPLRAARQRPARAALGARASLSLRALVALAGRAATKTGAG